MDLESHRPELVSVEDDQLIAPEGFENHGETEVKLKNNGGFHGERAVDDNLYDNVKLETEKSTCDIGASTSAAIKGLGLKKWRRFLREISKGANSKLDSNKKSGLTVLPSEMKQRSNGSVSPANATVNVLDNSSDRSPLHGDYESGGGLFFAVRPESEGSEDHSSTSRSSTAASYPRLMHEKLSVQPVGVGGKGQIRTKKDKGIKIEKNDSHSSMESDSRSSNFVFMQGTNSLTKTGRQSGKHLNKEAQIAFGKNEAESEDISRKDLAAKNSWEVKGEKMEYNGESTDESSLVESIVVLHSAQEALKREVENLREIGKEESLLSNDSIQSLESTSINLQDFQSGEDRPTSSKIFKTHVTNLQQNVIHLQHKLELKEAMVSELDELLKRRIESEIEYLVISRTVKNSRARPIDQFKLMEQQKTLESEHVEVMNKIEGAESKAMELKEKTEKLQITCEELEETENLWKLQNKVWRYTCYIMIQLILLLFLYLFVLKFSYDVVEVVPT